MITFRNRSVLSSHRDQDHIRYKRYIINVHNDNKNENPTNRMSQNRDYNISL